MNTKKTRDFIKNVCSKTGQSSDSDNIALSSMVRIKCLDDQMEELLYANRMDITLTPKIIRSLSVGDTFGALSFDLSDKSNNFFYISHSAVEIGIISDSVRLSSHFQ